MAELTSRLAVTADVPALTALMDAAIAELQRAFLDDAQIESSRAIMGSEVARLARSKVASSSSVAPALYTSPRSAGIGCATRTESPVADAMSGTADVSVQRLDVAVRIEEIGGVTIRVQSQSPASTARTWFYEPT